MIAPGERPRVELTIEGEEAQETERVYVRTVDAMGDPGYRRQILQGALREIESWRKRYAEYAELAKIIVALDEARKELIAV